MSKPVKQLTPEQQAKRAEAIRQAAEVFRRLPQPARKAS